MEPNAATHEDTSKPFRDFMITMSDTPTIAIPTLRFGRPATVTIFRQQSGPIMKPTEQSQAPPQPMTKAPAKYVITDAESKASLALAYTYVVSPVPNFTPTPCEQDPVLHPRDAHQIWYDLAPAASDAFFAGQPVPSEVKEKLPGAIRGAVGEVYLPWLQECCVDFFNWLSSPDAQPVADSPVGSVTATMDTIKNQEEALHYIDTVVRQKEQAKAKQIGASAESGEARIQEETEFSGHKAWKFSIEGIVQALDGGDYWLVDTNDVVRTGLSEDINTPEKAFIKWQEKLAELKRQHPIA
jgi:hypothetical protein